LFQLEASGDVDYAVAGDATKGELSGTTETAEAQIEAEAPLEDAEATMETDKTEV
jgi:hypothetical protein